MVTRSFRPLPTLVDPIPIDEHATTPGWERTCCDGEQLQPHDTAGEYEIVARLAAGGCGTVYHARHRILTRDVAIKVLRRDLVSSADILELFRWEARTTSRLRHPNIVDVFEFGELDDGRPYYVMELLRGENLEHVIRRHPRLSLRDALLFLRPICAALETAHRAGVVHCDLKASNVFVLDGSGPLVKLLDFGIARIMDRSITTSLGVSLGSPAGTPVAMAPEQIRGLAVDARADVYALGILAFHLVVGQVPFDADDPRETERMHLCEPPPRPSSLAPLHRAVDRVLLRALAKSPSDRPSSAADFLAELELATMAAGPL